MRKIQRKAYAFQLQNEVPTSVIQCFRSFRITSRWKLIQFYQGSALLLLSVDDNALIQTIFTVKALISQRCETQAAWAGMLSNSLRGDESLIPVSLFLGGWASNVLGFLQLLQPIHCFSCVLSRLCTYSAATSREIKCAGPACPKVQETLHRPVWASLSRHKDAIPAWQFL